MLAKRLFQFTFLLIISAGAIKTVSAQSTAFTYQGSLKDGSGPANGQYDFLFSLYTHPNPELGLKVGGPVAVSKTVTDGVFTAQIDFGTCPLCFDGAPRFLEIAVKLSSAGGFTTLSPRQPLSSTPYSIRSLNAASADGLSVDCVNCVRSTQIQNVQGSQVTGNISGSQINGTIPVVSVPGGSSSYIQNATTQQTSSNFNVSGNGTAGGTLKGNIVTATTEYNLGDGRILSAPGSFNLFVGLSAGLSNTTGSGNSFFGSGAGLSNATGGNNSFFGSGAGLNNTTGRNNSFFGAAAGQNNSAGQDNIFFGLDAGLANTTGNANTVIGHSANVGSGTLTNATAIGARAYVTQSNSLVLGAINGTNGCSPAFDCDSVKVGIGTTAPVSALHLSGNSSNFALTFTNQANTSARRGYRIAFDNDRLTFQRANDDGSFSVNQMAIDQFSGRVGIGTINTCCSTPFLLQVAGGIGPSADNFSNLGSTSLRWLAVYAANGTIQTSDARLKRGVTPLNYGLAELMRLHPVTFRWKDGSDPRLHLGLLAQEVEQVIPEAVVKSDNEVTPLGMNYSDLIPVLIKAGQEQQAQIEQHLTQIQKQQQQIETLKRQVQELDALKALICANRPEAEVCRPRPSASPNE